ncbi:MAG: glycosyltransferase family 4 protein [Candidatus Omnitrophota bacterium]
MKILNINNYHYVRGGSDRHYLDLGELLTERGNAVVYFSSKSPENEARMGSYFVKSVNTQKPRMNDVARFLYSWEARKKIKELIRKEKPNIGHLHIYYSQLTSSILEPIKKARIPLVQTLHEYKLICPVATLISHGKICEECRGKYFWKVAIKTCNRNSFSRSFLNLLETHIARLNGAIKFIDHFIAPSEFLREKMIQYGVDGTKISTLPNFINVENYSSSVETGEYFVFLGRLEKIKGVFTFLEAAQRLPQPLFLIIGRGEAENEIVNWIHERKLRNVRLLGFKNREETGKIIQKAICVVVPSLWYENCPISILEAFAMARPVVGSNIGGIPELIEHGKDGFWVNPGDADSLAEKLRWLDANRAEAVRMGLNARKKAEEKYSPPFYYSKLMEIYDDVLKLNPL